MRQLVFLLLFVSYNGLIAQTSIDSPRGKLVFYGDVMVSALEADNRALAADRFYENFKIMLDSINLFEMDLSLFRTLSVLEDDEGKFKIVSWQVERASYEFSYYGFILLPDGSYKELYDTKSIDSALPYLSLDANEWYGAIYYNIVKLDNSSYLVFGYNGYGQYDHVKVVDVINFTDDGGIIMGKEVFEDKKERGTYNQRLVIKYSSDASVNLNYNPGLKMIVTDHLMPRMGKQAGQGPTMIPDGTYEAYEPVDGKWRYIEKLYDHSYGENNAPRPKPVLDKKKDIFGN
jgi:hypothetical protein